jgi:putative oxidoreductase
MNASHATSGSSPAFSVFALLDRIPQSIISLAARIFPAAVFWMSGRTKVEGFDVTDNAVALFREEYALPLLDPLVAARLAAFGEHVFPALLVIGLGSRFAALALFGMTVVIEYVYPDAWPTHGTWATCFLVVIARGPGVFSLDYLLGRLFRRRP